MKLKTRKPLVWWGWLALGAGFLLAMWGLWTACGTFPGVSAFFRRVAQLLSNGLAFFTGLVPIPVAELMVAGLILGPVIGLVSVLKRRDWGALLRGVCRLVCVGCAAAFLFVFLYGVHHTAPSLASQMGLDTRGFTAAELDDFVSHAVEQANGLAAQVPRDGESTCDFGSFRAMAKQGRREYSRIKEDYAVFDRPQAGLVKRSFLGGRIMSYIDLAGYYCPWAAESTVSSDVVDSHIPFNIAHETAHALGIGPEAECNFAAWLACKDSEDVRFAYSGWLLAYIYAGNALYSADYEAWARQYESLCPEVQHDIHVLNESLRPFEDTKVNQMGSAANDALIKATGQSEGIRSYGRVVDLMLAYFSAGNE
ncbi:MAG: DUF3810 domain-containing protein [Clostridia bacterium]|nr:DUF3810 domain-containing protein [Clostridia bacterium]